MTTLVVVTVVVALAVIVALVATNPLMRRREDESIARVKAELGTVELIEPRTTAMGTEPEEAGGLRGMSCLGLSSAELLAVTWARSNMWRIPRASILGIDTPTEDATAVPKATIAVTYARPEGGEAVAQFRLRDAGDWLDALGQGHASDEDGDDEPDDEVDGDSEDGVALDKGEGDAGGS